MFFAHKLPLVDLIVSQIHNASSCFAIQVQLRSEVLATQRKQLQDFANSVYDQLPSELQSSVELACEKGASNWLSCLPLRSHGFTLHKSAFRDGLLLRYHWTPLACPTSCACGHDFTIDHCISCPKGGFPSLRHNEVCDLTAQMTRGPQQAEILDTDAEIRAEILLEIRDPKSQAIFSGYFHKIRKFISRELQCATSGFVAQ